MQITTIGLDIASRRGNAFRFQAAFTGLLTASR